MRTAADIATNLGDRQQSTASDVHTGCPTQEQMAELWVRMAEMYGHRWRGAYGDRDGGTWRAALRGLSADQLRAGLRACALAGEDWPPTLPVFRRRCTQDIDRSDGAAVAAAMPVSRALPQPQKVIEARRESARHWLAECRSILRAGTRQGTP